MTTSFLTRRHALAAFLAASGGLALAGCLGMKRPSPAALLAAEPDLDPEATVSIETALAHLAQAIDGTDAAAFAACFAANGVWLPGPTAEVPSVTGTAALAAWHAAEATRRLPTVKLPRHQLLTPVIAQRGDRAEVWAWLQRDWYRTDLNQVRTAMGTLVASVVREGEAWRFLRVERTCAYVHGSGPVTLLHNGKQRLAGS